MRRQIICCGAAFIVALYLNAVPGLAQHGHAGGGGRIASDSHGLGHDGSQSNQSSRSSLEGKKTADELLATHSKLSSKLQALLPPNTNLEDAAKGFKNLGQFVAAAHVSHNLGIPFNQLKAMMTGSQRDSLGGAIRALKPDADAKSEAKKAKREADDDMKDAS